VETEPAGGAVALAFRVAASGFQVAVVDTRAAEVDTRAAVVTLAEVVADIQAGTIPETIRAGGVSP